VLSKVLSKTPRSRRRAHAGSHGKKYSISPESCGRGGGRGQGAREAAAKDPDSIRADEKDLSETGGGAKIEETLKLAEAMCMNGTRDT